jgi:hypothetical protein
MPDLVIARVNTLGGGQPEKLLFTDRHGRVIGDTDESATFGTDEAAEIPGEDFGDDQKEDEGVIQYGKRMKTISNIMMKQLGGEKMITNIVAVAYAADSSTSIAEYPKLAWQRYLTIIERASSAKYGEFQNALKAQHSLGHDQYPKTLDEAIAILNAQAFDKNYKQKIGDKKKLAERKTLERP